MFLFREIEAVHYEALSCFIRDNNLASIIRTFHPFPMTDETAKRIALGTHQDKYYAAFYGSQVVAISMLRGWDEGYSVPSFGILVDHRFHNRGIGTRLTEFTVDEARRHGSERVRLSVFASNQAAHHIYTSRGFIESERKSVVCGGIPDERIIMFKELIPTGVAAQRKPRELIPVAAPALVGNEKEYVLDCLESSWISSNGKYIQRFEESFAEFCGVKHAASCCNGTAALHLALLALGVGPGDEVIVPTLTYVATANAVAYCGARPIFVDSEAETWNMDPSLITSAITPRTKGIIAVHLHGHPTDMDPLLSVASKHGLFVVEDAAEAHGAEYKGKRVGSIGDIATFSFYGNKIISTGEGGMVVTNDDHLAGKVRQLKGQGQDNTRRYWFPVLGYNYRMTNIEAAIGLGQMERIDWHLERRRECAGWYRKYLSDCPQFDLSPEAPWARNAYFNNCVLLSEDFSIKRDSVMEDLLAAGIETRPFFYPLHTLPFYQDQSRQSLPIAESLARRGLHVPSSATLTESDIAYVCERLIQLTQNHQTRALEN
jgi:perosamine synthetase